jgi:hypothetical protein
MNQWPKAMLVKLKLRSLQTMVRQNLRRVALAILVVAVVACGGAETTVTTAQPQPATQAEMEQFCAKYDTVRSQSWGEMTAALVEVSPAEIKDEMSRTSQPPGETWAEDREAVEDFLDRCDDL